MDRRLRVSYRQNWRRGYAGDFEHLRGPPDGPRRGVRNPMAKLAETLGLQKVKIGFLGNSTRLLSFGACRFGLNLGLPQGLFCVDLIRDLSSHPTITDELPGIVEYRFAADADMMDLAIIASANVPEIIERLARGQQRLVFNPLLFGDAFSHHLPSGLPDQIEHETRAVHRVREPCVAELGILLPEPLTGDLGPVAKATFALTQFGVSGSQLGSLAFEVSSSFSQFAIISSQHRSRLFAATKLHGKQARWRRHRDCGGEDVRLDKYRLQVAGRSRHWNSRDGPQHHRQGGTDRENRVASTAALNMKTSPWSALDLIGRIPGPLEIGRQWLTSAKNPRLQLQRSWSGCF